MHSSRTAERTPSLLCSSLSFPVVLSPADDCRDISYPTCICYIAWQAARPGWRCLMADWGAISVATCSKAFHINTSDRRPACGWHAPYIFHVLWRLCKQSSHVIPLFEREGRKWLHCTRSSSHRSLNGDPATTRNPVNARTSSWPCIHCIFICSASLLTFHFVWLLELFTFSAWRAQNKTPFVVVAVVVGIHGVWII